MVAMCRLRRSGMVREVRSSKRLQISGEQRERERVRKSKPVLQKKASLTDQLLEKQSNTAGRCKRGTQRGKAERIGQQQDLPTSRGRRKKDEVLSNQKTMTTRAAGLGRKSRAPQDSMKERKPPKKANGKQMRTKNEKSSGAPRTRRPRLTKKVLSSFEEETLGIRPIDRGSSWDGNSDSLGSVNSGVLDENLCFHCGLETTEDDLGTTILCDGCDGEYHLTCVGLTLLPRITWTCNRCREERAWFANVKYEVPNFKIPRRRSQKIEICYSPSRPLEVAWEECQQKGFMVVKNVFTPEIMRKLTHGIIHKVTSSGRVADTWLGAPAAIAQKMKESGHNLINRDGRFDLKLPLFVVTDLGLPEILEPILNHLRKIMKTSSKPTLRTHNIVFAPVGSKSQSWHVDDSLRSRKGVHSYFTILIHLNPIDDKCGGTEIWSNALKRGDMIRPRPGDAFVFNGSLLHRGQENAGSSHRFFYYASFSCGSDTNDAN